ncbi:MAG TPA: translation initiation factor IF-3 [Acidothermaceae bacterium]
MPSRRRPALPWSSACVSCGAFFLSRTAGRDVHRLPGGPISVEPRINDRIRVPEVRLVGPNGEQVGIVRIEDALRLAEEADLDLVEVAPMARPPVAKLMDYGKFKYESAVKAREARKNQTQTVIKEMKLRPKIDVHDYETKKGHVVRFLREGDKVKITIMFRGREQSRPEMGAKLLQRLAEDVVELGFVESSPKLDGRNMIMVLGPHKKKADFRAERASGQGRDGHDGRSSHDPHDLGSVLLAEHAPDLTTESTAPEPPAPEPAVLQVVESEPEAVAPTKTAATKDAATKTPAKTAPAKAVASKTAPAKAVPTKTAAAKTAAPAPAKPRAPAAKKTATAE